MSDDETVVPVDYLTLEILDKDHTKPTLVKLAKDIYGEDIAGSTKTDLINEVLRLQTEYGAPSEVEFEKDDKTEENDKPENVPTVKLTDADDQLDEMTAALLDEGGDDSDVDDIETEGDTSPQAVAAQAKASEAEKDTHGRKDPKFRLTIHNAEGAIGKQPVTVSVNGTAWEIKRGKEVLVPERVLHALGIAIETELTQNGTDEENNIVWEENDMPRFAYTAIPA